MQAEWRGGLPLVGGGALLCGFYLNELLLKLLPREDPHPRLFDELRNRARAILRRAPSRRRCCAASSSTLLAELGYALPLVRDADTGAPDRSGRTLPLRLRSRAAASAARRRARGCRIVRGATLLALAEQRYVRCGDARRKRSG